MKYQGPACELKQVKAKKKKKKEGLMVAGLKRSKI